MSFPELLQRRIHKLEARQAEIEGAVAEPGRAGRADYSGLLRELGSLRKVLDPWRDYLALHRQAQEARELAGGADAELGALAAAELPELEERLRQLENFILDRVLEDDGDGERPAIVEIRAGTGGEEAALFARDLFDLYSRYADAQGWKIELLDSSPSELGGFKELIFKVSGAEVFRKLRFESGGHRVQRVPKTEAQGRIHTSAATVAVLPEIEEMDFNLKPEELEITAVRSSGPGGQNVNKTSSAVRVLHKPTGIQVKCQEAKSQSQNRERALNLLRSRLYEMEREKRDAERAKLRRVQVGSGDRSERIRTYNWPQNRVTDHRVGRNFSLELILEGRLDELVEALQAAEREAKLASLAS